MSQPNNPNPPAIAQSEIDQVIGRQVFGPFKRSLKGMVIEAADCVVACEALIKEHLCDPDQEPSELDVKTLKSFYKRMQSHLVFMKAIPSQVEVTMSMPKVLASSRREKFGQEVQALLEEVKYANTLSHLVDVIGKYELWFETEEIELDTVHPNTGVPANVDHTSATGHNGSKQGSDSSAPRTPNSTDEKFSFDEPDYLDRSIDTAYRRELEARAATLPNIENPILQEKGQSKRVPTAPSGPNDSVLSVDNTIREKLIPERVSSLSENLRTPKPSPANSIRSARISVQEPKPEFPSEQPKPESSQEELVKDILRNYEERQANQERENQRAQGLLLNEIAYWRNACQTQRLEPDDSGSDTKSQKEPKRPTPRQEKGKRSPKPEFKEEPEQLHFTSSGESEEDEDYSYEEEVTSEDEQASEYRHATGNDNRHNSKYNLRKKASKTRSYHPTEVRLDEVRRNLISFNGTGRFKHFLNIFNAVVMANKGIPPFMKAILLGEHLKGKAYEYLYDLEDPLESIRKTFQDLEKTFGGKVDNLTLHDKFNSLPFHKTDCDKMIFDIAAHRKVMAQLEEKKVDINDIRSISTFSKKLPESISRKVIKYLTKAKDGEVNFDKVLAIVEAQIKVLKTSKAILGENKNQGSNEITEPKSTPIHFANSRDHQNQNFQQKGDGKPQGNHQPRYSGEKRDSKSGRNQKGNKPSDLRTTPQPASTLYDIGKPSPNWSMVAWSFPFGIPEQGIICVACDGPHNPARCPLTSTEFRKKLQDKNLCERCTRKGHKAEQCQKWYKCAYCQGDHAMGGCPLKEFYRKRENIPSFCTIKDENSPKKPFFRRNGKNSSQ